MRICLTAVSIAILTICLCGCGGDLIANRPHMLAVEGWIEQDEPPIVILSATVDARVALDTDIPMSFFESQYVHDAIVKVTVNHKEYLLQGKEDNRYPASYIYTTDDLRGEEGHSYDLDIEWHGQHFASSTEILPVVALDSVGFEKSLNNKTSIVAHFKDNPETKDYYQLFVQTDTLHTEHFTAAFLGSLDDDIFSNGEVKTTVYKGKQADGTNLDPFFNSGEKVRLKLCHIDLAAYQYWISYHKAALLSQNQFFPMKTDLKGNIAGALGYWFGYGTCRKEITIP